MKRGFLIILAIWIFMSATIQRCISSVLLNSYLKTKPAPLFNDMREIYLSGVKIAGSNSFLENSSNFLEVPERFLNETRYSVSYADLHVLDTIQLVLNEKAVIFDSTIGMEEKMILFKEIDRLTVMENKYSPTYITFWVHKDVANKTWIMKM